jgi:serine-type D-Ala-D-Ala carboxypeptidase/endopeptidase (penicillin-binding protein 4)
MKTVMRGFTFAFSVLYFTFFISSCSIQKRITKSAKDDVLNASALQTAHVGISIYESATGKYWYDYNGDKYFVPASNVKIPTCYAAMKYLGDSLVGIKYGYPIENAPFVAFQPTGDPTFLHKDFKNQPVFDLLVRELIEKGKTVGFMDTAWRETHWGNGWSWNDYEDSYMRERNSFPIFGNVIEIELNKMNISQPDSHNVSFEIIPSFFESIINYTNISRNRSLEYTGIFQLMYLTLLKPLLYSKIR